MFITHHADHFTEIMSDDDERPENDAPDDGEQTETDMPDDDERSGAAGDQT